MSKATRFNGLLAVTGMVLVMGTGIAGAGVLNLDFGPTSVGVDPANTTVSPYHQVNSTTDNATWNTTLGTADIAGGLVWGDGSAATGVSINLGQTSSLVSVLGTQPTSSSALGNANSTGIYASPRVIRDGIFHNATGSWIGVSLQISGLPAGTYNIYYLGQNTNLGLPSSPTKDTIYAGQSDTAGNFDFSAYINDTISHTVFNTASFIQNVNFAKVTINLAAGSHLNLGLVGDATNSVDKRAFLNALQLEQVAEIPEPASLVLMGLGGLVMIRRRRA